MIVEGQIHGGLGQGIGQAMLEQVVYDRSGQLLTGSFIDYAMPRATDLPSFKTARQETLSPDNLLGVKGAGESGTIGAPAAMGNAVLDALWHLGVRPCRIADHAGAGLAGGGGGACGAGAHRITNHSVVIAGLAR